MHATLWTTFVPWDFGRTMISFKQESYYYNHNLIIKWSKIIQLKYICCSDLFRHWKSFILYTTTLGFYDCLALIMISLLFTVRYILKITNQQQSHIYSPKQLFMVAVNKMQISIIKVYITFEYFPQTSLHLGLNKSIYVTQKLSHSFTSVVLDSNFKMY